MIIFFVSISSSEYIKLKQEEQNKLFGIALTDVKPNVEIIEKQTPEPLKKEVVDNKKIFKLFPMPKIMEFTLQSYKTKHMKALRSYAPRTIVNKNFNSKKKGGR